MRTPSNTPTHQNNAPNQFSTHFISMKKKQVSFGGTTTFEFSQKEPASTRGHMTTGSIHKVTSLELFSLSEDRAMSFSLTEDTSWEGTKGVECTYEDRV